MTDQEEVKGGRSRRERRRAAKEAGAQEGDEQATADVAEVEAATDEAGAAEPAKKRASAGSGKKRKKKKALSSDEIRDRNKRLREEAAERRRAKRKKEGGVAQAQGLDASEMVDDALARWTHAITKWVRDNATLVQWVAVLAVAGGIGWQVYSYVTKKERRSHTDALANAVAAELGAVGTQESGPDDTGLTATRPAFKSDAERLKQAAADYEKAIEDEGSQGALLLAKLGLAGVRFEQGKYDEALKLYESVKSAKATKKLVELRGRALEGIGLTREAKGDKKAALKAFGMLENMELSGFTTLALYHKARLELALGNRDKALELLKKAEKKLEKDRSVALPPNGYLDVAVRELRRIVDPESAAAAGMPGTEGMTPEQVQRLQQQLQKLQQAKDPKELQKLLEEAKSLGMVGQSAVQDAGAPAEEEQE